MDAQVVSRCVDNGAMRRMVRRVAVSIAVVAGVMIPAHAALAFTDVPSSYWDYTAITYMAQTHTWMQDYGTSLFQPTTYETRELYARSLVQMYAPDEPIDPSIVIKDLPATDPFYRYANVSIKLGWMPLFTNGNWAPTKAIKTDATDRGIVSAMGSLGDAIKGLAAIHEDDGDVYTVGTYFPYIQLAHWLGLHYNHGDETLDLNILSQVKRDEIAYTLWMAQTVPSWEIGDAADFDHISLPALTSSDKQRHDVTQYALNQLGFPYIWGGEWNVASPTGYCCGSQPQGGMDCSGFAWWVMKKNEANYNAAQYHPAYAGWSLPERVSHDMAKGTVSQIKFGSLKVGDIMFFATDGGTSWSDVDHVGIYLGNNWMIHSSGSGDGPDLESVASGSYYNDIFVYGRRLIGVSDNPIHHPVDVLAGDGPREGGERRR